ITTACGQPAAFQAVALNTDTAAMGMAPVIDQVVDYFYRKKMPYSKERLCMLGMRGFGASYQWWRWDKWAGDDIKIGVKQVPLPPEQVAAQMPDVPPPPPGTSGYPTAPIDVFGPSGAPVAQVLWPWREYHEIYQPGRQLWRVAMETRSKFELMALYPDQAAKIRALAAEY